jgi:hypothetical protein
MSFLFGKTKSFDGTKKVNLIDGLNLGGSYNFLADSFQLSVFNIGARSNLFDKISITAGGTLDPYEVDSRGDRLNRLVWKNKIATLGRFVGGNISVSSQFQGGDKNKKKNTNTQGMGQPYNPNTGMPLDEYQTEAAYINNNPAEFADFSIPWSFNFSYSLKTEQVQYYSLILLISSFTLVFLELNIFVLTLIDVLQVYCLLFKISY